MGICIVITWHMIGIISGLIFCYKENKEIQVADLIICFCILGFAGPIVLLALLLFVMDWSWLDKKII